MIEKLKNKKNILIALTALLVCIILFIVSIVIVVIKKNERPVDNREALTVTADTISEQKDIDDELTKYEKDKSLSLDNPKIIVNPYGISPLTAIIIFYTSKEVSYDVYINDNKFTTMESSKTHKIPIYGLVSGEKNKIKLTGSDGTSKEYEIETTKEDMELNVTKESGISYNDFYFVASPTGLGYTAFNKEGKLVWYLNNSMVQDIEFLSNGHLLIANNESHSDGGCTGLYEVDYLGKIYHQYILENFYRNEVQELSNGDIMVAGNPEDSKISSSFVYVIDRQTGATKSSLDFYGVIANISKSAANSMLGTNAWINSFDYNEETDELLYSFRNLSSIVSVQYSTGTLNWIIGDKDYWPTDIKEYVLTSTDSSRTLKGPHSVSRLSNGNIGVFNNDFDPNTTDISLQGHINDYSSAVIYSINTESKTYKTVWEYDDNKQSFSYAMGNFNEVTTDDYIINFGYNFKRSAFDEGLYLYNEDGNTFFKIVEIDSDKNISFEATFDGASSYRVFKHKFYEDNTSNYEINEYELIDSLPGNEMTEVSYSSVKDNIINAIESPYDVTITKTSLELNASFDITEKVDFAFVNESNKVQIFNYKQANSINPVRVNLDLSGKYSVYIIVNDVWYKLDKNYTF